MPWTYWSGTIMTLNRAVFNWVSKVICVLLRSCFISLCDCLKNLAPLSRPIRRKTQTAGYMYLLRVLIGSLGNLCLLWLAGVITLVLGLRHSFEKRSNLNYNFEIEVSHQIHFGKLCICIYIYYNSVHDVGFYLLSGLSYTSHILFQC